ncbi:MAG: UDP-glucose dehydrogenase family protein [Candidatus Puniceispirillaceae bacterium]
MKIVVIGTGYVGLVSGTCFSEFGFDVTCVDKDQGKIDKLRRGEIPIYEPGLDDLVRRNLEAGRLHFTTELSENVPEADVIFIAVGTPTRRGDGHADLSYVYAAAEEIAASLSGYSVIVTKSTVPVGTGRALDKIIAQANPEADFDIASNPEFLREGSAINDFMRPDRVVVGTNAERAIEMMRQLYRPLYLIETPILFADLETAELIKYAANAFLAVKISFINQIADLCEAVGANVHEVAKGMGLDKRIGSKFLHAGPGYGGSCFPKDTLALVKTAEMHDVPVPMVEGVVRYNEERKIAMASRIKNAMGGSVKGKKIAVLGLAFKPETDDMRDSPALAILPQLVADGAIISAYDPAAMTEAKPLLPDAISYVASAADTLPEADCCVVITEWNEFRALRPEIFTSKMKGRVMVDLRNLYDGAHMRDHGIVYHSIGRPDGA